MSDLAQEMLSIREGWVGFGVLSMLILVGILPALRSARSAYLCGGACLTLICVLAVTI